MYKSNHLCFLFWQEYKTLTKQRLVVNLQPDTNQIKKMKNLFFTILLGGALSVSAQNFVATDTLGIGPLSVPEFSPNNQVSRPAYAGGWAFGVNNDPMNNITGLAQAYNIDEPKKAIAILALFAGKSKGAQNVPNTKMTFQVRPVVDSSAFLFQLGNFVPTFGPGAVLASQDYFYDEADTTLGTINLINLSQPIDIAVGKVAVSVDFAALKLTGDKIGFLSDAPGNGLNLLYTYHYITQGDTGFFIPTNNLFQGNLNINVGLFLVMGEEEVIDTLNIQNTKFENGFKASLFPNPVQQMATLAIKTEKTIENTDLMIMDLQGKLMMKKQLGLMPIGSNTIQIDTNLWPAGQYIYSFGNSEHRISRLFQVVR